MKTIRGFSTIFALALLIPGLAAAAEAPATTRYMVTVNKLKPGSTEAWQKVYRESVVPALKKAGVTFFSAAEQIFGERPVYVHVRSLEKFGELDGQGPFQRAGLSQKQIDSINAIRNAALVSEDRFIANSLNDLMVPSGPDAPIRVVQFFRPHPGQGDALRALLRSDVLPAWQQAKQAGRISGAGVATTGQGRPGLYILWTDYPNLAALDAGNMMLQTMGPAPYALFLARLAQLGRVEESSVSRRISEISYSTN
jgi:hypothetical protein